MLRSTYEHASSILQLSSVLGEQGQRLFDKILSFWQFQFSMQIYVTVSSVQH